MDLSIVAQGKVSVLNQGLQVDNSTVKPLKMLRPRAEMINRQVHS